MKKNTEDVLEAFDKSVKAAEEAQAEKSVNNDKAVDPKAKEDDSKDVKAKDDDSKDKDDKSKAPANDGDKDKDDKDDAKKSMDSNKDGGKQAEDGGCEPDAVKKDDGDDDSDDVESSLDLDDKDAQEEQDDANGKAPAEAKKDLDDDTDNIISPKPFEKHGEICDDSDEEDHNAANGTDFEAFKNLITPAMANIAKSFELTQHAHEDTNERLDKIEAAVNDLHEMLSKSLSLNKDDEAVTKSVDEEVAVEAPAKEEVPPEADKVDDDEDVYVAEKTASNEAAVQKVAQQGGEDAPKDDVVEKSLNDLYNEAQDVQNAYVDRYTEEASHGVISREEYAEKSAALDDVVYGRDLTREKLQKFVDYATK